MATVPNSPQQAPTSYPPSAVEPSAATILAGGAGPAINAEKRRALGARLASKFKQYESDRRLAELKWERSARQVLGVYDNEVERSIDKNRSRAYPKLTRWKCVSMRSRLMNLLFPADDKNWTVSPSAVPNLDDDDMAQVLTEVMLEANGEKPADELIEQKIREFARKRAARLELEIEDQLQELGGDRGCDYVSLARKVLDSGVMYGCGILKGPFVREETRRRWDMDADGKLVPVPYTAYRPHFEFVPLWDYYPDMAARRLSQMDGQFERVVMSRHQTLKLKDRPDFFADQIDAALRASPDGNYQRKAWETELRALGVQINVTASEKGKFEALVWEGYVSGHELAACGVVVPDSKLGDDLRASVWIMGDYVIRAQLDPWTSVAKDGTPVPMYHHFIFEEDESFLLGNGLPQIVRDSQLALCAVTRMALDNGAVQRVFEVNRRLAVLDQDLTVINPDQIIMRDDETPADAQYPAIRAIDIPMHLEAIQGLAQMFQRFADNETFVSAGTGGDMQEGPSEPFRTAAGASMLRGDAALPFKDVVRSFDRFTESVIGAVIGFNALLNTNPNVKGDFMPVARGATSLIAKEVLGIQLDNLAATLTPEEKQYVNMRELARARMRVRDLDTEDLVYDDAKCDQIDQQAAQQAQQQQQAQLEQIEATTRKLLSDALKNIAQAGKNTAGAQATTANVILNAIDKGMNPDDLVPQGAGDGGGQGAGPAAGPGDNGVPQGGGAGGQPGAGNAAQAAAAPAGAGGFVPAAMPAG